MIHVDFQKAASSARASLVGAAILVLLAACGGSGDTDESSGGTASAEFNTKVEKEFQAATADQTQQPPATGPQAVAGKKIFVIPCGMTGEGCARTSRAVQAAAKDIGWQSTLIDPQFDPGKTSAAIRQAISAKADAIVLEAIDSSTATAALKEAKAKGIKLICWVCNNEPAIYDYVVQDSDTFVDQGYMAAQAAYELAGKKLNLIMMRGQGYAIFSGRQKGTEKFIDECAAAGGDCKVVDSAKYQISTVSGTATTTATSLARKNPGYNVFWEDFDTGMGFMSSALTQANLAGSDQLGIGFDGDAASVDQIRQGGFQKVTVGSPATWVGYAQVDTINRLLQGEDVVDQGVRAKVLVPDNVPPEGAWDGDVDVRPAYLELWGK